MTQHSELVCKWKPPCKTAGFPNNCQGYYKFCNILQNDIWNFKEVFNFPFYFWPSCCDLIITPPPTETALYSQNICWLYVWSSVSVAATVQISSSASLPPLPAQTLTLRNPMTCVTVQHHTTHLLHHETLILRPHNNDPAAIVQKLLQDMFLLPPLQQWHTLHSTVNHVTPPSRNFFRTCSFFHPYNSDTHCTLQLTMLHRHPETPSGHVPSSTPTTVTHTALYS